MYLNLLKILFSRDLNSENAMHFLSHKSFENVKEYAG